MAFIDTIDDHEIDAEVRAMYDRQQASLRLRAELCAARSATGRTSWRSGRRCRTASGARWTSGGSSSSRSPRHTRLRAPCARSRMAGCSVDSSRRRTCSRSAAGEIPPSLTPAEAAMVGYARKVAADATTVTADDVQDLKRHGFSDGEIFDIAATSAARAFWSKLLDARRRRGRRRNSEARPGVYSAAGGRSAARFRLAKKRTGNHSGDRIRLST